MPPGAKALVIGPAAPTPGENAGRGPEPFPLKTIRPSRFPSESFTTTASLVTPGVAGTNHVASVHAVKSELQTGLADRKLTPNSNENTGVSERPLKVKLRVRLAELFCPTITDSKSTGVYVVSARAD